MSTESAVQFGWSVAIYEPDSTEPIASGVYVGDRRVLTYADPHRSLALEVEFGGGDARPIRRSVGSRRIMVNNNVVLDLAEPAPDGLMPATFLELGLDELDGLRVVCVQPGRDKQVGGQVGPFPLAMRSDADRIYVRLDEEIERRGFAGAGVWSPDHGAVVAILVDTDSRRGGVALPLRGVRRVIDAEQPDLPSRVLIGDWLATNGYAARGSVIKALEYAASFARNRADAPDDLDHTVVVLGCLAYSFMSGLYGVTLAFLNLMNRRPPAMILGNAAAAAGVREFDVAAIGSRDRISVVPRPVSDLRPQPSIESLFDRAKTIAAGLGGTEIRMRHLVAAALIEDAGDPAAPLSHALEYSGRDLRELLRQAAIEQTGDAQADVWDELLGLTPTESPESAVAVPAVVTDLAGGIAADRVDPRVGIPMERDQLDTAVWVSMLATVIVDRRTPMPLSIGIFGEWGSGKSHFMGMLRQRIGELAGTRPGRYLRDVIPISFNAWHYSDANLWASLGDEIFRQLAGSGTTPDELRAHIRAKLAEQSAEKRELEARTDLARDETVRLRRQLDEALTLRQRNAKTLLHAAASAESVKGLLKEAWAGLGIRDDAEQAQVLADQLRDSVSTAIELRGRFRRKGTWIAATLGAVAVAFLVAAGWLPSLFGRLSAGVTGLVGLTTALGLGVRWATKASAALGKLNQAATEIRRLATEEAEEDLTAAFEELHAAEARESVTRTQLAQVDAQVAELTQQLAELMPGQRLYSFIAGRAASDAYATHLGLISTIRRDFEQLVELIADWHRADGEGGSPRPVDRIVLYIDDLDRCRPRQVVEVLQAVHLLLALDLFVVVVGVDPRWLLRSLRDQYGGLLGGQAADGPLDEVEPAAMPQEYLEKIFNIPFTLPSMPPGSLGRMIRDLVRVAEPTLGVPANQGLADRAESGPTSPPPEEPAPDRPDRPLDAERGSEAQAGLADTDANADAPVEPPRQLTEPELALLGELEALVDTPRAGKRLLNLYRMLRSTRDLSSASSFLGDESTPGEFQAVVVLLGLVISDASLTRHLLDAPARAGTDATGTDSADTDAAGTDAAGGPMARPAVAGGLMARPAGSSWSAFVGDLTPDEQGGWHNGIVGELAAADLAAWQRLAAGLARVNSQVTLLDLTVFQRWAPHVRRFSFILSPLAAATNDGSHMSRAGT